MRRIRGPVRVLLAALLLTFFGLAGTESAAAAEPKQLEKIDAFLRGTVPAYGVARTATGILVDTCRGDASCQEAVRLIPDVVKKTMQETLTSEAKKFPKKLALRLFKQGNCSPDLGSRMKNS